MYPNIMKAALELAYDNGMINRYHPEQEFVNLVNDYIDNSQEFAYKFSELDNWIGTLSYEEIYNLVTGEDEEIQILTDRSPNPEFTDKVFITIFEL